MRLLFLGALALATVHVSAADWQAIGPWGGPVVDIQIPQRASNRAYALTVTGLFRTDDRGVSWRILPAPGHYSNAARLATTASNANVVVVSIGSAVYRSIDGGDSWNFLVDNVVSSGGALAGPFTAIALDGSDPDRIVAFQTFQSSHGSYDYSTVFRWYTEDGGQSAQVDPVEFSDPQCPLRPAAQVNRVFAAAFHEQALYYAHSYRCVASDLYGEVTRLKAWSGDFSAHIGRRLPVHPQLHASGEIVLSENSVFARTDESVYRIGQDAVSTRIRTTSRKLASVPNGIVSAEADGLYASTDGGTLWGELSNDSFGLHGAEAPQAATFAAFEQPNRWLASNDDGIFARNHGADDWQFASDGHASLIARAIALAPGDEARIWLGIGEYYTDLATPSQRVLYRTSDGGSSWQHSDIARHALYLRSLDVDPATAHDPTGAVIYASGRGCRSQACLAAGDGANILKSVDSGATWQRLTESLPQNTWGNLVRSIRGDWSAGSPAQRHLYATHTHYAVSLAIRSSDSGGTWGLADYGLPAYGDGDSGSESMEIAISPSAPQTLYLATYGYSNLGDVDPAQPSGIFRSDDRAMTWTHRSEGLPRYGADGENTGAMAVAVHPGDPDIAWAVTMEWLSPENAYANRVFKTIDGGLSWFEASAGLPPDDYRDIVVEVQRPDYLYVSGMPGVYYSTDGGVSWQPLGDGVQPGTFEVRVGSEHVFAAGYGGVHRVRRPNTGDPVFCSGFEPNERALRAGCSARPQWFRDSD